MSHSLIPITCLFADFLKVLELVFLWVAALLIGRVLIWFVIPPHKQKADKMLTWLKKPSDAPARAKKTESAARAAASLSALFLMPVCVLMILPSIVITVGRRLAKEQLEDMCSGRADLLHVVMKPTGLQATTNVLRPCQQVRTKRTVKLSPLIWNGRSAADLPKRALSIEQSVQLN